MQRDDTQRDDTQRDDTQRDDTQRDNMHDMQRDDRQHEYSPNGYSYQRGFVESQKSRFNLDDVLSSEARLDFSRPFLPESLARCQGFDFLLPREQLLFNQIRAHGYLYLFGVVEEFILPFLLERLGENPSSDPWRTQALLGFAGEESKHIQMFRLFREDFASGFGSSPQVIGPPQAIADEVLGHDPLAVALVILQIEWMTQRHYVESVHDQQRLDARYKSLLKHHFMEEVQHAKLDALLVEDMATRYTAQQIERAVQEYFEIGLFIDGGLSEQAKMDKVELERAIGRRFTQARAEHLVQVQHQALRWTFLGSGMTHPKVLATFGKLGQQWRERLEQVAPAFC